MLLPITSPTSTQTQPQPAAGLTALFVLQGNWREVTPSLHTLMGSRPQS